MATRTTISSFRVLAALGSIVSAVFLTGHSAKASEFKIDQVVVTHPWSRATPGGAPIGVGYVTITNKGKTADTLLGGSVDFARRIEIHTMTMVKGVMRMRKLKGGLVIAPGQTVALKPGGDHLMLVGLTRAIKKGQPFKAVLRFEKAGALKLSFKVEAIGAMSHKDMARQGAASKAGSGSMTESMSKSAPATMEMKPKDMKSTRGSN